MFNFLREKYQKLFILYCQTKTMKTTKKHEIIKLC